MQESDSISIVNSTTHDQLLVRIFVSTVRWMANLILATI